MNKRVLKQRLTRLESAIGSMKTQLEDVNTSINPGQTVCIIKL